MKVGTIPRRQSSGRSNRWLPEGLHLSAASTINPPEECRVCGKLIAQGEMSWGWRWKSSQRGHSACGWYRLDDGDAVGVLLALNEFRTPPNRYVRNDAFEMFLILCRTTQEHDASGALRTVKNWYFSAAGIALLRLVRAAQKEAAE